MSRPVFRNKRVAIAVGLGAFALGWLALHDAWEGRGGTTPKVLRPFTWW